MKRLASLNRNQKADMLPRYLFARNVNLRPRATQKQKPGRIFRSRPKMMKKVKTSHRIIITVMAAGKMLPISHQVANARDAGQ